jgi:hypothetical protein
VADPVAEAADRLYGLPLEDFTRERDAAARALRSDKQRDAAAEVAKLRKPGAGAWAVNAIAREQPRLRDELLEAGDELRAAQDAAIAGRGARELREATARERAAVDAVLDAAAKLRPGGRALSGTAADRLRQTLHAAAVDREVREAIAAGRLVRDAEGGGAWPFAAGDDEAEEEAPAVAETRAKPVKPKRAKAKARAPSPERAAERRRADREAAQEAIARREAERAAAARRRDLEAQLASARRERTSRERDLTAAARDAERATERLERARVAAEEARDATARLEEQLD